MAMILQKICKFFVNLVRPARRPTRVSFSPSTLHSEERQEPQGSQSSPNGAHQLRTRKSMRLSMSDDQNLPYRNIATDQRRLKRLRRHPRRRKRSLSLRHRRSTRSELDLSNVSGNNPEQSENNAPIFSVVNQDNTEHSSASEPTL